MTESETIMSNPGDPAAMQPRFKSNAKQKASGEWYMDVTVELYGKDYINKHETKDEGNVERESVSQVMGRIIKESEDILISQGRTLVGTRNESA